MTRNDLADAINSSRFLDVFLCERDVIDIFRSCTNDFTARTLIEGLPDDMIHMKAWHSPELSGFFFRFAHTTFKPVYPGTSPPVHLPAKVLYERCPACREINRRDAT